MLGLFDYIFPIADDPSSFITYYERVDYNGLRIWRSEQSFPATVIMWLMGIHIHKSSGGALTSFTLQHLSHAEASSIYGRCMPSLDIRARNSAS